MPLVLGFFSQRVLFNGLFLAPLPPFKTPSVKGQWRASNRAINATELFPALLPPISAPCPQVRGTLLPSASLRGGPQPLPLVSALLEVVSVGDQGGHTCLRGWGGTRHEAWGDTGLLAIPVLAGSRAGTRSSKSVCRRSSGADEARSPMEPSLGAAFPWGLAGAEEGLCSVLQMQHCEAPSPPRRFPALSRTEQHWGGSATKHQRVCRRVLGALIPPLLLFHPPGCFPSSILRDGS